MKQCLIVFLSILCINFLPAFGQDDVEIEEEESGTEAYETEVDFRLSSSFGMTFQSLSQSEQEEIEELQWLFNIQSSLNVDGENGDFAANLFFQFGQFHSKGEFPVISQDYLLVSLMPSFSLIKAINLQLFLEITAQTSVAEGEIDGYRSKFLDPLFLYETLFLGQKFHAESESGGSVFDIIYGLGYAVQQTFTQDFVLQENRGFEIGPDNPLSNVQEQMVLESGYSAVFKISYDAELAEDLSFYSNLNYVAFTKDAFFDDIKNSTVSGIITAGLQYSYFSLDYNSILFYDKNFSKRRQLDQTLVFGLKFDL